MSGFTKDIRVQLNFTGQCIGLLMSDQIYNPHWSLQEFKILCDSSLSLFALC